MKKKFYILFLVFIQLTKLSIQAENITLFTDQNKPQILFASDEIKLTLETLGHTVTYSSYDQIALQTNNTGIIISTNNSAVIQQLLSENGSEPVITKKESYSVRKTTHASKTKYYVIGNDLSGAMYGGIDLAEQIELNGLASIVNTDKTPYVEKRGLKFNIPLDARTPSYADFGSSAQANIETVWDMDFWKEFIDDLAKYHYNNITLWNEHPFPSMIKLSDYPDVALDDVKKTTYNLNDLHASYSTQGKNMTPANVLNNLTTVKTIPINDKIKFWQDVMQYGKDRGIEFYFFTWNVFVYGAEGKYGITGSQTNSVTTDYYKKSIKQMFVTYPLLAGIGFTAGENMSGDKETWLYDVYAEGMMEAMALFPGRNLRLIHRAHQTSLSSISNTFNNFSGDFDFSFKYSYAHIYGNTDPIYADGDFNDLPSNKRAWIELRNDDIFNFRWGNSDFVRDFVNNFPPAAKLRGFVLGSDGYVWGREFTSTEPETTRELEISKHWYHFMLWGRLSYDPQLSNDHFKKVVEKKLPQANGNLYQAWTDASKIIPTVTEFHWWGRDLEWAIEGCIRRVGWPKTSVGEFHSVNDFITTDVEPGSNFINIEDYVNKSLAGTSMSGPTPLDIAANLKTYATNALSEIDKMGETDHKTLRLTKGDISAMALLGHYYAEKILGATAFQFYKKTNVISHKTEAIAHLESASDYWLQYATIASSQYNAQILARNGHLDWLEIHKDVLDDIKLVRGEETGSAPVITFEKPTNLASFSAPGSIQVSVSATDNGSVSNVKLFLNDVLIRQESTAPYEWGMPTQNDVALSNMDVGTYTIKAIATDNEGNTAEKSITITIFDSTSQTPFKGIVAQIPGSFEAEDYDEGAEGVSYHDTTVGNSNAAYDRNDGVDIAVIDATGGYSLVDMESGEWVEYTVNVAQAGLYDFGFLYASASGTLATVGASLEDDVSQPLFSGFTLENTTNWTSYKTATKPAVQLPMGQHVLRLSIEQRALNIDKVTITKNDVSASITAKTVHPFTVFPNPSPTGVFNISMTGNWSVYSSLGQMVAEGKGSVVDLSSLPKSFYVLKFLNVFDKLIFN